MTNPSFISALKSDRCVHYLNNTLVNRAQSIDVSASVPAEVIDELGNTSHAGIITSPAVVNFSVSAFDTGVDMTRNLTGKSGGNNFTLADFAKSRVDYVGIVRDNSDQFFRSVYVRNAVINGLSYGFDVSGNATESYTFSGDNMTVFDGFVLTKHYSVQAADVTNQYFTLPLQGGEEPIPTQKDSYFEGAYLLRVTCSENGEETTLVEGSDYTYTFDSRKISTNKLKAGQIWTIVFYSAVSGTPINPDFNQTAPPAVRGEFTPVSIGVNSDRKWIPRLQSTQISIGLNQARVPQLGSNKVLYTAGGVPQVSGQFNVLMSDLALRKTLTYGADTSAQTQFGIEQLPNFGMKNDLALEVLVKSPTDNSILKRITVPDIVTHTGTMPATVNGTLMESFSWMGKTGKVQIANS